MHSINPDETFDLVIHRVGNRALEEGLHLSKTLTFYPPEISDTLYNFFTKPFKTDEYFQFKKSESARDGGPVFSAVKTIFEDNTQLLQSSHKIAEHLYKVHGNPKAVGGDLFVVYFPDALIDGVNVAAIGIFKSDKKQSFLKAVPNENSYDVWTDTGILLSKMDKACLIFNVEKEAGYLISSIDNSKGEEFGIWGDEFLGIEQVKNEYFDTENTLNLCKSYVMDKLPEEFEVSKVDQVDLLNKSMKFFKENENFELGAFSQKVLEQDELKQSFDEYKKRFEEVYEVDLNDHFEISKNAVKKQTRFFKSIIKLDKNFHIYVHGNRRMIEQGIDEEGKKYYKLFYDSEN